LIDDEDKLHYRLLTSLVARLAGSALCQRRRHRAVL
jgi:hypothetical protein